MNDKKQSLEDNHIRIRVEGAGILPLDKFEEFQGDLKTLDEVDYQRLRSAIIRDGITYAVHIWIQDDCDLKHHYILDGHQRVKTVKRMVSEDGFICPYLPYAETRADSFYKAKEILLTGASQYGRIKEKGLETYLKENEIAFDSFTAVCSMPEVDFSEFKINFLNEKKEEDEVVKEPKLVFSLTEIVEDAFSYFRKAGFPYPNMEVFEMKQSLNRLANLVEGSLLRTTEGYKVADHFNRHRFSASANGMKSPVTAFNEDKDLKKALKWRQTSGEIPKALFGEMTLVNGTQACSNFRPGFARYIYEKYSAPGSAVFDSSTGYGGRLTGFLASHAKTYLGVDPNVLTYNANSKLADTLGHADKEVHLFNAPIEDLDLSAWADFCDLAFTSPPYFTKEIYSTDETQSCQRYPEADAWYEGFLRPMLQKQFQVLKAGAMNIVNIEDVTVGGVVYPLVEKTIEFAKEVGFEYLSTQFFEIGSRTFVRNGEKITEQANESVLIFKKPETQAE